MTPPDVTAPLQTMTSERWPPAMTSSRWPPLVLGFLLLSIATLTLHNQNRAISWGSTLTGYERGWMTCRSLDVIMNDSNYTNWAHFLKMAAKKIIASRLDCLGNLLNQFTTIFCTSSDKWRSNLGHDNLIIKNKFFTSVRPAQGLFPAGLFSL